MLNETGIIIDYNGHLLVPGTTGSGCNL